MKWPSGPEAETTVEAEPVRAHEKTRSARREAVDSPWPASSVLASASPATVSFSAFPRLAPVPRPNPVERQTPVVHHPADLRREVASAAPKTAEPSIRWPDPLENPWPELPQAEPASPDERMEILRIWERRRRVDEEQRGIRWSA